jgi:hypothetical protein
MPLKLHKYKRKSQKRQREDIELYAKAYFQGYFDAGCDLHLALYRSHIWEKKKVEALMARVFKAKKKVS